MDIEKTVYPYDTTYWGINNISLSISEDFNTSEGTFMIEDGNRLRKMQTLTQDELNFIKRLFELEED